MDLQEALAACERIVELIDDEVPNRAKEKAPDFFEDVKEKVISMSETLTKTATVTPKQESALNNWEIGVRKWIKD